MTAADREAAARRQRAQEIALWRWTLVEPAMDPALTARQRGQVVRDLASREHQGPDGRKLVSVSRRTLDRWAVARRDGGFEALVPCPRQCEPRADAEVVDLAVGLKMENPQRTAAQVRRVLAARLGWAQAPSERAIQRWLAARELNTRPDGKPPQAFGRFEAGAVNEIWTADLMNGPVVGGRDCHLSVIIDDRSRYLTAARFVRRPDAVRFAGVFRAAIAHCGLPSTLYCDNGSCYADKSLQRTCAVLGVKLTHSQPGRPPLTGQPPAESFVARHAGDLRVLAWGSGQVPVTFVAMSEDLLSIRVAEVRAGRWELAGAGELSLFNDFLGYVADRGYSPRTVRAYAFDLLHFARWLAADGTGLDEAGHRCPAALPGREPRRAPGRAARERDPAGSRQRVGVRAGHDQPAAGGDLRPVRLPVDARPGRGEPGAEGSRRRGGPPGASAPACSVIWPGRSRGRSCGSASRGGCPGGWTARRPPR